GAPLMPSRIRRFDIAPPSGGSLDAPEGRQRQLFGYRFEDHLHAHPGPEAARRDVAQVSGEADARVLDELDQRRDVRHAIAGEEGPVDGDPGEETRAAAGRGPGLTLAAAVRTRRRGIPHPAPAALAARDAELARAAAVPEGPGDGPG